MIRAGCQVESASGPGCSGWPGITAPPLRCRRRRCPHRLDCWIGQGFPSRCDLSRSHQSGCYPDRRCPGCRTRPPRPIRSPAPSPATYFHASCESFQCGLPSGEQGKFHAQIGPTEMKYLRHLRPDELRIPFSNFTPIADVNCGAASRVEPDERVSRSYRMIYKRRHHPRFFADHHAGGRWRIDCIDPCGQTGTSRFCSRPDRPRVSIIG